ncbi:MAG: DUF2249 domain-containing protein [Chromatiales bacterium]|nr:DUF2249 domain-containing protein [Chromatiales bacterium]
MEITLDVSELEPCEPLEQTLSAIDQLQPGDFLHVFHRREPLLLFPLLEKKGVGWHCREGGPAGYEIYIWMADDAVAEQQVRGSLAG